jgi:sulfotransferase family protein
MRYDGPRDATVEALLRGGVVDRDGLASAAERPELRPGGALPNLVIIGAMKCGTTSLHHYLDLHPEIGMSRPKELNFFFGPEDGGTPADVRDRPGWARGHWHHGPEWYAGHFDPAVSVRGEASPGYTSPSYPEVAARMAELIPDAQLLYAVRDPISRALSQYEHHRRQGTERREPAIALLDPGSQYIARGRYVERLEPFLATGAFDGRVTVVAQEELAADPRTTLRVLFGRLGVDEDFWTASMDERRNASPCSPPHLEADVRVRLGDAFRNDADRLRALAGREFPNWTV